MTSNSLCRQPSDLWLCSSCLLEEMDIGDYLHIRRIETSYIKCKSCYKNLAEYQFLTRNILKETYP